MTNRIVSVVSPSSTVKVWRAAAGTTVCAPESRLTVSSASRVPPATAAATDTHTLTPERFLSPLVPIGADSTSAPTKKHHHFSTFPMFVLSLYW